MDSKKTLETRFLVRDNVVSRFAVMCYVHMVLYTNCICGVGYIWYCVHVVQVVLYIYGRRGAA